MSLKPGAAILVVAALVFSGANRLCAQVPQSPPREDSVRATNAPLFEDSTPLTIRLLIPMKQLRGDRGQNEEERPGQLVWLKDDGSADSTDIKVRTRGIFRLRRSTCQNPPLRLNLQKKAVKGSVFEGQDKVKLVAFCRDNDRFEQYTLQEYLIYRMYNLFTPKSFRVRLVRATYVDTERPDSLTQWGFLREDEDAMAARNGLSVLEMSLSAAVIDLQNMIQVSLFQYFIGNTDWGVKSLHNMTILADERQIPYAVPFDFDWSGVIDAPYAEPDTMFHIRSVRDRVFTAVCRTEDDLRPTLQRFMTLHDTIYTMVREQPQLDPKTVKNTLEYFDEFYKTINDPRSVRRQLVQRCVH